jgi:GTP-binding nuclear protein Ran
MAHQNQNQNSRMSTFKIVVIGPSQAGKTTYLTRLRTGEFQTTHQPTLGVDVHPYRVTTTHGPVCVNFWDCAGAPEFTSLGSGYYNVAHGALVVVDLNQPNVVESIISWIDQFHQVCPESPIVVVGTKQDLHNEGPNLIHLATWLHSGPFERGIRYYSVSARSNYNLEKPLVELLRMLKGSTLQIVENPPVQPPDADIPAELERRHLVELVSTDLHDLPLEQLRQVQTYLQTLV